MTLNYIWFGFFAIAFLSAVAQFFAGNGEIFKMMVDSTFEMAKVSVNISIGLIGVMAMWLGIMRVGEKGGAVNFLAKVTRPLLTRLFPQIPADHPAMGSMVMNIAANMLGLDNAATPLGLKAMKDLQSVNAEKETASDAQIMFLVLNTSGLTLIPISVLAIRAVQGAAQPADVFLPILMATTVSTIVGLLAVSIYQKINLFQPVVIGYLGGVLSLVGAAFYIFTHLPPEVASAHSATVGNFIILALIMVFVGLAFFRKVNVYEEFVEGAKEGFQVAIQIIPYLVAMLVAIGLLRASGALLFVTDIIGAGLVAIGGNPEIAKALPTAIMKPLSGSGARGMMVEAMETFGADSFAGRLASTFQGSTETTFYVLAVYFGSVGIKNTRYAVVCGLIADLAGIIAAIILASFLF